MPLSHRFFRLDECCIQAFFSYFDKTLWIQIKALCQVTRDPYTAGIGGQDGMPVWPLNPDGELLNGLTGAGRVGSLNHDDRIDYIIMITCFAEQVAQPFHDKTLACSQCLRISGDRKQHG